MNISKKSLNFLSKFGNVFSTTINLLTKLSLRDVIDNMQDFQIYFEMKEGEKLFRKLPMKVLSNYVNDN